MKYFLFLTLAVMFLLVPVQAEETAASQSKCPYLASLAASEAKASEPAADCPMAAKAKDGKACCADKTMKSEDGRECCKRAASTDDDSKMDKTCARKKACCSEAKSKGECPVTGARAETVSSDTRPQTMCPVMNREINKKHYVDHNGKRVYVCCPGCIGKVKADPEKYIQAMEKDGIELEKVDV